MTDTRERLSFEILNDYVDSVWMHELFGRSRST